MAFSKIAAVAGSIALGMLAAGSILAQSAGAAARAPQDFGVQDYTITYVPGVAFYPGRSNQGYYTSGSQGRFGDTNVEMDWYAAVDIPRGAVIDYVGLNNYNDGTAGVLTLNLEQRYSEGSLIVHATVSNTGHSVWKTDLGTVPGGFVWQEAAPPILNVHQLSSANMQFIGYAEIWWRRSVSAAPGSATFNDVPTGNPYFQFVEALFASGITAGCGGGNYCPNNLVTRAQMAVFMAKALGLHWGTPAP